MSSLPTMRYVGMFVLVATMITGCTTETPKVSAAPVIVQPGAPGEPGQTLPAASLSPVADTPFTAADVLFMQGMIPHHAQALRMTALVPSRSTNRDITLIAKRIQASQEDEIALMRRWLQDRDQKVPDTNHDHSGTGGELMPGMLTEEQFDVLKKATGTDFDRAFVQSMINHHLGALQMVDKLFNGDGGGGQETEIFTYASHVGSDQRIEIDRMQKLLAQLDGPAPN
ncbi:Uncharacterized conserved protein, DUF305 family [Streptosporangium subroseum]|uniref:Uncharacterized conserved protein, DUF305 family n=2 Tax=Streptosporangium subroseum TaxID=106412 RepID=A0A239PBD9_9ACTN|nr:Uncharacterized conserved protein, DUF305 family [Streptosporangium subroseum]